MIINKRCNHNYHISPYPFSYLNKLSKKITPVTLAVTLALAPFAAQAQLNELAQNNQAGESRSVQTYNLPAGSLSQVLSNFSQQAGVALVADANKIQGLNSKGLQGQFTVEQGFATLLKGTSFTIKKTSSGYILINKTQHKSDNIATLATAVVGSEALANGSREDGYRSDGVTNVGVWQGRELQETPYSINVASEDLLQNLQATSTDQVFKVNPLVQIAWPQAQNDSPYLYARGFLLSGVFARDGVVRYGYNHGLSMEEVAKVEVLSGLSGFLYGPGNVGGLVNMVTKRPTEERLNSITLGNTSGSNLYAHGDFGGRFGEDNKFGYRVNLVAQDGETAIAEQELKRNFGSIALDWQVTDDLLLQVDASTRDYHLEGLQTRWFLDGIERPDASSIQQDTLYAQPFAVQDIQTDRAGLNMHWNISDNIALRAAYLTENTERYTTLFFSGLGENGVYNQDADTNKHAPNTIEASGGYLFMDADFNTGSVTHKFTVGVRYDEYKQVRYGTGFNGNSEVEFFGPFKLSNPQYVAEPNWVTEALKQEPFNDRDSVSVTVGDDIRFNDQWSALIGLTHSTLKSQSYFSQTSYDESEVTPSVSVVYTPISEITIYTSFMESLEPGQTASDKYRGAEVINAGEITKPLVSEQIEVGIKAQVANVNLTAALFEIDKPFEYYQSVGERYQLVQDGRQVHRGLEFTATGQLTDRLTIIGGFTLLDAQVQSINDTLGTQPREVAEQLAKLYGEYEVSAVNGLFLNVGVSYTGDSYADVQNTDKLDAYTLVDVGARYALDLGDNPLTLRLNISNLTEEEYWVNRSAVGDGRRVIFSANMTF